MIDQLVLEEKSPNIISFPTDKKQFQFFWIKAIVFFWFFCTSVFILFHIARRKNAIKLLITETEVLAIFRICAISILIASQFRKFPLHPL